MFHAYRVKMVMTILVCALLFTGCARPGDPPTLDRIKPLLRLAVTLGTDRVLTEHPSATPTVLYITQTLTALFREDETATAAMVDKVIKDRLASATITPEVRLILEALLEAIKAELRLAIERADILDTQVVLLVREMTGWIQDVALRHMQAPVVPKKVRG